MRGAMADRVDQTQAAAGDTVPVTFGTIRTDCVLLGRRADGPAVEARLDDVARHRLPHAIAEALAPALSGIGGVIRINRLSLAFDLGRAQLDSGDLARVWARRIAAALHSELVAGPGINVAVFADHGDFAAAYLESRFGEAGHPDWAFEDFAPLRYLAPAKAAVEILKSRPDYLPSLARRAERRGNPARLVARLSAAEVLEVLDALRKSPGTAPSREEIEAVVIPVVTGGNLKTWQRLSPEALSLTFVFRAALADSAPQVARLVAVAEIASAVVALASALAGGPVTPAAIRTVLHRVGPGALPEGIRARLSDWTGARHGMTSLLCMVEAAVGADAPHKTGAEPEPAVPAHEPVEPPPVVADTMIASPFAGVALCLTTLRRLDIPAKLGPEATHAIAVALLAPERRALARTDPLIARLFPADARRALPDWPMVPDSVLEPLSQAQRNAVSEASGDEAWALAVIAHAARSLPGLAGSSAPYMRKQFLHVGGVLHWLPDAAEVTLDPIPLGIVLSMAGAIGWQGPIPWLDDRDLVIRIRDRGGSA
ncbi:hypothetical protein AB0T83_11770 [Fluviibacterium sp. DFM31]|uniref:Uncharacterized protein n=1 Tax=Meridianimarinicoccus marinus TaxID=3231483 RepID=A0ABV3L7A6_9RHOB